MEKLLKILDGIMPQVDFRNTVNLIDDGILDSFDIVALVAEINDAYDIEITVEDLTPENFNTIEGMMELINRLENEI